MLQFTDITCDTMLHQPEVMLHRVRIERVSIIKKTLWRPWENVSDNHLLSWLMSNYAGLTQGIICLIQENHLETSISKIK